MIIRKPYAFLIKHYKIINLLLLVPMLYITLKFGDISKFFQDYIRAKYSTPETIIAGKYITALTYIVLIFLILYNLTLYILMKSKMLLIEFLELKNHLFLEGQNQTTQQI